MQLVLACFLFLVCFSTGPQAQVVEFTDYWPLRERLSTLADFEDFGVPTGTRSRVDYNGRLVLSGLSISERLTGQSLRIVTGAGGPFDAVTGSPSLPLTLMSGQPWENLALRRQGRNVVLYGSGKSDQNGRIRLGESSIAMLFEHDQAAIGMRVFSLDTMPGRRFTDTLVKFYDRQGSLLKEITLSLFGRPTYVGFQTIDGASNIAAIVVTTTNPGGVGLDDIIYSDDQLLSS